MVARRGEGYTPKQEILLIADKIKANVHVPRGNVSWEELYPIARDMIIAYCKKMNDGLALYRPISDVALKFHSSLARTRAISGSNQCLGADQTIYDPVKDELRRVSDIKSPFHVMSIDTETGEHVTRKSCRPFIKGHGEIVRVTLSNGKTFDCTRQHKVRTSDHRWVTISEATEGKLKLLSADAHLSSEFGCHAHAEPSEQYPQNIQTSSQLHQKNSSRKVQTVDPCQQHQSLPSCFSSDDSLAYDSVYHSQKAMHAQYTGCSLASWLCFQQTRLCTFVQGFPYLGYLFHDGLSFWSNSRFPLVESGVSSSYKEHSSYSRHTLLQSLLAYLFYTDHQGPLRRQVTSSSYLPPPASLPFRLVTNLGTYLSALLQDAAHWFRIPQGWIDYYWMGLHQCDAQPLSYQGGDQASSQQRGDGIAHTQTHSCRDGLEPKKGCTHHYQQSSHPSSLGAFRQAMAHAVSCLRRTFQGLTLFSGPHTHTSLKSPQQTCCHRHTSPQSFDQSLPFAGSCSENSGNTITITDLVSIGDGDIWDITVEGTSCYICQGILSRNSGKTSAACSEVARIWRGMDPYGKRKKENLKLLLVGKDALHISSVIWQKLWLPGLFNIVPDEVTGLWRAVRPEKGKSHIDPIDAEREELWMPSPPLLPPSAIKSIAWERKNQNIPKIVMLHNGSEGLFYSSKGLPRQGIELDLFYCDEELENKAWLSESRARLLRRDGIMIASFTPQSSTPEYFELHQRAVAGDGDVEEFQLTLENNPYITAVAKKKLYDDLKSDPDELAVRYYGHYAIKGRQVYPGYSMDVHYVEDFTIPQDWMVVLAVDPGAQYQTAVFAAIPPKADEIHIFNEIYLLNSNAYSLACAIKKILGDYKAEAFIIDYHGGKQRPMGYSNTVAEHYEYEFHRASIESRSTGNGFIWGSDNIPGREHSVKRWLRNDDRGRPLIKFHDGMVPVLDRQLRSRFYKKNDPNKRDDRLPHDTVDCLEYLAAFFDTCIGQTEFGLFHEIPVRVSAKTSKQYKAFMEMEKFYKKVRNKHRTSISLG